MYNIKTNTILSLMLIISIPVRSFQPISSLPRTGIQLFSTGKGFGAPPPAPKKPKTEEKQQNTPASSLLSSSLSSLDSNAPKEQPMNAGQQTLMEMRRRRAEERDAELRKVKELREMDKAIQEAPAAIPEKVAMRMGQRMLPFVGLPLFLGLGSFVLFWYLATYQNMEFEPVTVAGTTIGLLIVGLLGITYSIFSTSWDEDREGDLLGLEEASKNLQNVRQGLGRARENAILRDNIAGLGEDQIEKAILDLESRDAEKLKKELLKNE